MSWLSEFLRRHRGPVAHDPQVMPFEDAVEQWVARCPCGWSVQRATYADAVADGDRHREAPDEPEP